MKDKEMVEKCIEAISRTTQKYQGCQEAGCLIVQTMPKNRFEKDPATDNLEFAVGGGGNPYAVSDAIIRRMETEVNFRDFMIEIMLVISEHFQYKKP